MNTQTVTQVPLQSHDIEKIKQLFNSSAMLAGEIESLAQIVLLAAAPSDLPEEITLGNLSVMLETLAQKVGFLCDQGSKIVGDPCFRGGAEAWLLPPVFTEKH